MPAGYAVRMESAHSAAFLILPLSSEEILAYERGRKECLEKPRCRTIYRFDPERHTLEGCPAANWPTIGDVSGTPADLFGGTIPELERKSGDKLLYKGSIVPTAGRAALSFAISPRRDMVAVLSAEHDRDYKFSPSLIPFTGDRGPAEGRRLHQVFRMPEMVPMGEPIPLPKITNEEPTAIWSPDQRYVIYLNDVGKIWIVKVEVGGSSP